MSENNNKDTEQCTLHSVSGSCFWGHKWSKWTQYTQELIDRRSGQYTYEIRQKKVCLRCNKMVDEWVA